MRDQIKNVAIGVFLLAGLGVVIWFILFLKPSVGDGKETLYVRFSDINQITVGTRVTYAGKPVGEVVAIREIHDARSQPSDILGRVYFYQLTLKVDSGVKVYNTDEIALQTSGLLGEKSVAIIPKAPPIGVVPKLITNQPVYADSVDPIANSFFELSQVANQIEITVKDVRFWFDENKDRIAYAIKWFGESMHQASIAICTINEEKVVHSLKEAIEHFSGSMQQVQDMLVTLKNNNTFQNIGDSACHLRSITASLDIASKNLATGKGTLGKLLTNDDLYLRFTAVMSKVDTLMNDINHYGLMFNLNKQWQRLRLKRVTLLNALDTPYDFKMYFEGEVDQINTAMSRLSILIDRAGESKNKGEILQSVPFKKDFGELLREVDDLAENLRLYNQKLMELQENCD